MPADRREPGQLRNWPDKPGDIRSMNIRAAREVAEIVRSTLGPLGMDKLLIDDDGMGIVTNDGATVLKQMAENPVLTIVRDASRGQESAVEDGTTTTAVLTGHLLAEAEGLLAQGVHPASIIRGYETALERTEVILREAAVTVAPADIDTLRDVALTAMTSKGVSSNDEVLADLVVEAVERIADEDGFDTDDVYVEKEPGGWVEQSSVASNVMLDTGRASAGMPRRVEDATLALVDEDVEVTGLRMDSSTSVADGATAESLRESDRRSLDGLVDSLVDLGVDVLVCGGRIDEQVRPALDGAGIYAAERVDDETTTQVAGASGATVVHDARTLEPGDLGSAESVMELLVDGESRTSVEGFADADVVTLVLRGSQMNLLEELYRALEDGLEAARLALADGGVVPGGGASELAAARALRTFATGVEGRDQLAVDAFADALEVIPRTLVENAGRPPLDGIVALRSAQERDGVRIGVDGHSGEPVDVVDSGVLDLFEVKEAAIDRATRAATTILGIDDALPTDENAE